MGQGSACDVDSGVIDLPFADKKEPVEMVEWTVFAGSFCAIRMICTEICLKRLLSNTGDDDILLTLCLS